jgi:hypothetical protein
LPPAAVPFLSLAIATVNSISMRAKKVCACAGRTCYVVVEGTADLRLGGKFQWVPAKVRGEFACVVGAWEPEHASHSHVIYGSTSD